MLTQESTQRLPTLLSGRGVAQNTAIGMTLSFILRFSVGKRQDTRTLAARSLLITVLVGPVHVKHF